MDIANKLLTLNSDLETIENNTNEENRLIQQIIQELQGKAAGEAPATATFAYTNSIAGFLAPSTFWDCSAFHELNYINCTQVGREAFFGCDNLEYVNLPMCGSLDGRAFRDCNKLKQVNLGALGSISAGTFGNCSQLLSVQLGSKCGGIGSYAFNGCANLVSINAPMCSGIDNNAFMYCTKLEEVVASPIYIGAQAFYGCENLKSFTFPDNLAFIGYGAFAYCKNLSEVYYNGTASMFNTLIANGEISYDAFYGVGYASESTITIHTADGINVTMPTNGEMDPMPEPVNLIQEVGLNGIIE